MNKPRLQNKYQPSVREQWRDASDGEFLTTKCPASGERLAECAQATEEGTDDTVREAWKVFETWKKVPTSERAAILSKIAGIIDADVEYLATVESLDSDKPIHGAMAIDIPLGAKHFHYFANCTMAKEGSANILDKQFFPLTLREPIGVVGQIAPWNFPFLMAAWKPISVLTTDCCTVFKPSSDTPLSVLEFARLMQDVIPKGAFDVITGSGSKPDRYTLDHKRSRKLAPTDSTEVGRQAALTATDQFVPTALGLGGRSTNIFFPDCNWEQAIDGLQLGILFNQDRVCCVDSRAFVHKDIYDKFLEDAVKVFNNVGVSVSWDPETQMGSQTSERQLEKILSYVEIGKQEGAHLICGGEHITDSELTKGRSIRPTLLADVTNDMQVAREEVFGPIAYILKFRGEGEVIHMTNDNVYGLGGAVWTRDLNRVVRTLRGIETGCMWVNTYNQAPEGSPFGGYREPGIGRETHKVTPEHYTQMKDIMINLSEAPSGFYPAE